MKIHLVSDLHLEFIQRDYPGERLITPVPGTDVLVLAGDIANGAEACKLFADWRAQERIPIIYVAGNHEYYGRVYEPMLQKIREGAAMNNIHFLENNSVEIGGVRFLGCTMWTDYKLEPTLTQAFQMDYAGKRLNDHRLIRKGRYLFSPKDALALHMDSRAWLKSELAKPFAGKTVVVTHHAPHLTSVHARYASNPLNAGFVSNLAPLMENVDLWLHGHVHDGFDYEIGGCRVVANPAGYIQNISYSEREGYLFENKTFDKNMVIEI
jgi:Icc-related predicted phosphoesterase